MSDIYAENHQNDPHPPVVECPRCNETDERAIGMNRCGLCECEFFVACNGSAYAPAKRLPACT
jgi:hypothetical protein